MARISVNPISIDIEYERSKALELSSLRDLVNLKKSFHGRRLIMRFERTDMTKGIVEGLRSFATLLREHPEHRGTTTLYCALVPHRGTLLPYQKLLAEMITLTRTLNREFSPEVDWDGISTDHVEKPARQRPLMPAVILDLRAGKQWHPYLLAADVAMVTPVIDGMNLVAKCFATLRDPHYIDSVNLALRAYWGKEAPRLHAAVMVASTGMGAKHEIDRGALMVDPRDERATAEALHNALTLSASEVQMHALRTARQVGENTASDWSTRMLGGAL